MMTVRREFRCVEGRWDVLQATWAGDVIERGTCGDIFLAGLGGDRVKTVR